MGIRTFAAAVGAVVVLAGCATPPQGSVDFTPQTFQAGQTIGVALAPLPAVDTAFPGAGCLLCMATASMANSSLTSHAQSLPSDDVLPLKERLAEALRAKGSTVKVIAEPVDVSKLAEMSSTAPNTARRDFRPLKARYGVDKLLVVEVQRLGFNRNYSAYVPNGDPKAVFYGQAYIVDLGTNGYDWYRTISVTRAAEGAWDEPPKFPGLTNAYYQALEMGKDAVAAPFKR